MTSRAHLERALALAAEADELLAATGLGWPEQIAVYERVTAIASVGRLHLDAHQALWMEETDPLIPQRPALGVAAPVVNLPHRPDSKEAPASPAEPAEAPSDSPRKD